MNKTFALRPSLLLASVAGLCLCPLTGQAQQYTPPPPPGTIIPFEVCQTVNPVSGMVESILNYDGAFKHAGVAAPGTLVDFFSPGDFDLGQPDVYFPGTDNDAFEASYYLSNTDTLTWAIDGSKYTISVGSAPPCNPAYFQAPSTLTYSAPGTYTHQLLGTLPIANANVATNIIPVANSGNLSFANLTWTITPPFSNDGVSSLNVPTQYLYGDVTVGAGPAVSTSLLVQVLDAAGRQIALGTDTLQFAGTAASTAGCPSNITGSVQGKIGAPVQLFGTQIWTQTVTIKNTSGTAIAGPIQLALGNLSGNAHLFTAAGTGTCPGIAGSPYITIANGLAPNAYGAVVLTFTNSMVPSAAITYTPTIVAGGSRL